MNERIAFIRAIAANPYDDTARLAFADWLDENGEPERAEFIRVQVELEPIRDKYEITRAVELHAREKKLFQQTWEGSVSEKWRDWRIGARIEFRRGFPDILLTSAKTFIELSATIRQLHPMIRRVVIHCLSGWGERLAACDALKGLAELELACWYADDDMKALAASPHLSELQVLVLWLGRSSDCGADSDLCKIAAKGKAWPNLRELVFLDPQGNSKTECKALITSANHTAKRKLAKYERGYPELFPFAADFAYGSPGRLPDGRLAFASPKRETEPKPFCGWEVWTFDPDGTPLDEILRVPLPPELLPEDWSASYGFEEQRKAILAEKIGFVPGFIRVKDLPLWDDGPRRGHYEYWDLCGTADDPEHPCDRNGDPDPNGYGGRLYELVRNGEFVVAYDAWADKRGQVHST